MAYTLLEVLLGLVILFLYYQLLNRKSKIPTNWPIVGMLPGILANFGNFHEWVTDILRESGCTFRMRGPWLLDADCIGTCDPANVHHVFTANFDNYPKGGEFSEIFDVLGDGIFNADGDSWRSQRKMAHGLIARPGFLSSVAESSHDKVENGLVPLLGRLADDGAVVDLQDIFFRLTLDMTCNLVFGVDPGCLSPEFPTVPFARAMDDAMEALFVRSVVPSPVWKLMRWLRIGKEKRLSAARGVMEEFVSECIAKSYGGSLISWYVDGGHDYKFVRDTAVNFMLAGRDTVAVALAWFFWLVSGSPSVESRIIEELRLHEVAKSVYLHAALCESLRLYPPVPYEHKGPARADVLPSGERAAAGRKIVFSAYAMGRMEGVWGEDCREFRPERWVTERGSLRRVPPHGFPAFNCGPRTCVGRGVAFAQMKEVAAAVFRSFRVEAVEGHVVEPKISVILRMKNGWKVRIKRRNN